MDSNEGSGLYYSGDDSTLDQIDVNDNCKLVELTIEEYGDMQYCGCEVEREGEKVFIDQISDLLEGEMPNDTVSKNKINIEKAKKYIKDRMKDVTINLHGVSFIDRIPDNIITKRR